MTMRNYRDKPSKSRAVTASEQRQIQNAIQSAQSDFPDVIAIIIIEYLSFVDSKACEYCFVNVGRVPHPTTRSCFTCCFAHRSMLTQNQAIKKYPRLPFSVFQELSLKEAKAIVWTGHKYVTYFAIRDIEQRAVDLLGSVEIAKQRIRKKRAKRKGNGNKRKHSENHHDTDAGAHAITNVKHKRRKTNEHVNDSKVAVSAPVVVVDNASATIHAKYDAYLQRRRLFSKKIATTVVNNNSNSCRRNGSRRINSISEIIHDFSDWKTKTSTISLTDSLLNSSTDNDNGNGNGNRYADVTLTVAHVSMMNTKKQLKKDPRWREAIDKWLSPSSLPAQTTVSTAR